MTDIDPLWESRLLQTRRQFFGRAAAGIGVAALASLVETGQLLAGPTPDRRRGVLDGPHIVPKARRVIYLFQSGAPSQLDLFDYKPSMRARFDEDLPDSIRMGQRLTTMTSGQERFPVAPTIFDFQQHGQSRVGERAHAAHCADR